MSSGTDYAALIPYAQTEHQRACIEAVLEHGSQRKAAAAVGCARRNLERALSRVKRTAALAGYSPEHDLTRQTAPGFRIKRVSSYYQAKEDGPAQWVIQEPEKGTREQLLLEAIREVSEGLRGKCPKIKVPKKSVTNSDLLSLYPIGDMHMGLMTWAEEVGENFDLDIAESLLCAVVDELVRKAPPSDKAILLDVGDLMHVDNYNNETTRSGYRLDADGRYPKILKVTIRTLIYCVKRMLEKHREVELICVPGNHNDVSAIAVSVALGLYFDNEKRVTVDDSPAQFRYRRFGKVLLGATHGHLRKKESLDAIMAVDRREDWGKSLMAYWHVGHLHHDIVKDLTGARVETHRVLAPADAHAHAAGYRSSNMRDMKCIIYHQEWGEVARHTVNPLMFRTPDTAA